MTGLRSVTIGEVLLDVFPDGQVVLGGAPFNIAWHLRGFELNPLLITRIGQDAYGDKIWHALESWHLDTQGIQIDPDHPTGRVEVTLPAGQPHFHIPPDQAFDFIEGSLALAAIQAHPCRLIYHGTLATRTLAARQTLLDLHQVSQLPLFLDLNLRDPWWDRDWLDQVMQTATWVKMTEAELATLRDPHPLSRTQLPPAACHLHSQYGYAFLAVTMGEDGAMLVLPDRLLSQTAPVVDPICDTVGAGDAFSAVLILGIHEEWRADVMVQRAIQFASATCRYPGGTIADRGFYQRFWDQWQADDEDSLTS
ncbi:MAG: PfkB family carbohydrate kinase [Cyanobacteriota bacterium]|nr:PfkB family carbohydrate kinase [Cyanobacteriota bacterium]